MPANKSITKPATPPRTEPLPYALYDSNGILFELYRGGKPFLRHSVTWARLEPVATGNQSELLATIASPEERPWPTS